MNLTLFEVSYERHSLNKQLKTLEENGNIYFEGVEVTDLIERKVRIYDQINTLGKQLQDIFSEMDDRKRLNELEQLQPEYESLKKRYSQ